MVNCEGNPGIRVVTGHAQVSTVDMPTRFTMTIRATAKYLVMIDDSHWHPAIG